MSLRTAAAASLLALLAAAAPVRDPIEVDLVKLTSIEWREGDELPDWIQELDGEEVVVSGFMQSRFREETDQVLIVSDSCQCSGTPLPHHFLRVTLDAETDYKPGQLTFLGELSVGEEREHGFVTSLYRLDGSFF